LSGLVDVGQPVSFVATVQQRPPKSNRPQARNYKIVKRRALINASTHLAQPSFCFCCMCFYMKLIHHLDAQRKPWPIACHLAWRDCWDGAMSREQRALEKCGIVVI